MHDGRFARIERMIGSAGLRRLMGAHVVVVGLGAVGSYATEGLARAGVGHLRLVDFDEIRLSNINRQLYALDSTVGRRKVEVAKERVKQINPACEVEALGCFVHAETMETVLAGRVDLIIDAIDSLSPKVELLAAVRKRQLPIVSSMGAALRTDPTSVRVGPLSEVHHCPLAAKIRKRLRKRDVPVDMTCVYSIEPVTHIPEEAIDREGLHAEETLDRGRKRRTLGSLPTLTGIFGLTAANTAIRMMVGSS
ncbi:MAG TPA: tRNA threonylcarbamoyladenosine dehydratase [Tepidisphaeraceae bacterium]|nr:tRNA threonylcarbamoyladenosine dehydratase [Tepidisphaeraceae bacterium]